MIAIEQYNDGYRVTETDKRWTYYVYPDGNDLRNNGPRYKIRQQIQAPRLTLPMGWTLGDVINAIVEAAKNDKY